MQAFLIFIQKEFFHILRDRRTLLILLGMPIALVILFGFAITNEINDARIAILDHSRDDMTQAISQRLVSSGYFKLDTMLAHPNQIERRLRGSHTKLAIVFPHQFQERFERKEATPIQIIADGTDPNTATTLVNYASAIINNYQQEQLGLATQPYTIKPEVKMLYNPELKGVYLFVPGVMTIILMLVSAMMTSIAITKEKELGTMEVLLVSPLRPPLIILGKVVPYILIALVNTVVILLLGTFVFGMPVRGSLVLLLAECFLFVLTALALGILISTRTDSQQIALLLSLMVLMLPTILLSGFIFPIESMPEILQYLSHIIPAKWFIIILKNIMLKGTGMAMIWQESLVLFGMLFFFLAVSIRNFKIRLE
jgi:ABC-2 type transport system permease protein